MHIPTKRKLEEAALLSENIAADKATLTTLKEIKARLKANEKELKRLLRGTTTRKPKAKAASTDKPAKAKKQNQFGAFSGETKAGE